MRAQLVSSCLVLALGAVAAAGTAPKSVEDGDAWLVAHGSKDAEKRLQNACCCVEVSVGRPAERALDCQEERDGGHAESADIVVSEVVRVVRGGKVVKVLEALVGMQNLDWRPGSRHWLDLHVTIAADGRSATIVEAGDTVTSCGAPRGTGAFETWVARVCASRGTYRWRGGRFVRAAK